MIRRPRFKSHFLVRIVEPDLLFLLEENRFVTLEGRLYVALAPHINGKNSVERIAARLDGRFSILDVRFGVEQLERAGYIEEGGGREPRERAAYREMLGVDQAACRAHLAAARIAVRAVTGVSAGPFVSVLRSLGLRVRGRPALTVVLTDDYLREELREINREALASGGPWMLVKLCGAEPWIGPLFRPGSTGCWACLAERLAGSALRQIEQGARPAQEGDCASLSVASLPATTQVAANLAALEVWKWVLRGCKGALEGTLLTFDSLSTHLEAHQLVRRDGCPACGTPRAKPRRLSPLSVRNRKKTLFSDGGHRSAPPEATMERLKHHISPLLGVAGKLESFHEDPRGLINVWLADHNFPLKYQRSLLAQWTAGRKSAGKGMSRAQAMTGALCEALERYSGVFRGNERRITATYRQLGVRAVHPSACLNISPAQYRDRAAWNECESDFNWIPEPFDESRRIEWSPAFSLTRSEHHYLPTAWCYYNYPPTSGHDFCRADSNGNAAGTNIEEAILQGFMEVVERDAVAIWWYNRISRPAVDLRSFAQPYFAALANYYEEAGRELCVLDVTSDFGIPVMAAISRSRNSRDQRCIMGFGAHFDPVIAISRALTEMNQFLPSVFAGREVRLYTDPLPSDDFLRPNSTEPRRADDYAPFVSDDLKDEVLHCVDLAKARGLETLVLDQTRPDTGLCVVKVVIPGMRTFWARFGPGRLYDVPVAVGWLHAPLAEEQLNPCHLAL